jgi:hypothetical protein
MAVSWLLGSEGWHVGEAVPQSQFVLPLRSIACWGSLLSVKT